MGPPAFTLRFSLIQFLWRIELCVPGTAALNGTRWSKMGWLYSHQVFDRDVMKTRTSARGTRGGSRGGFQEEVVLEEVDTAWTQVSNIQEMESS